MVVMTSSAFIRLLADGLIIPVVLLGVWALLRIPREQKYRAYCRILLAGLTAFVVAKLLAQIYQPEMERPFEVLGRAAGAAFLPNAGFPSDHTLFCTAIALAVWFETKYKKLAVFLFILTVLIAIGRVLALVHTPLDVIGGIVIAGAGIPWYLQRGKEENAKLDKKAKK